MEQPDNRFEIPADGNLGAAIEDSITRDNDYYDGEPEDALNGTKRLTGRKAKKVYPKDITIEDALPNANRVDDMFHTTPPETHDSNQ